MENDFHQTQRRKDEEGWRNGYARTLMVFLNGQAIPEPVPRGERIQDSDFLLLFNAHSGPVDFVMPPAAYGTTWRIRLATAQAETSTAGQPAWQDATTHAVAGRSIVVLESVLPTKS